MLKAACCCVNTEALEDDEIRPCALSVVRMALEYFRTINIKEATPEEMAAPAGTLGVAIAYVDTAVAESQEPQASWCNLFLPKAFEFVGALLKEIPRKNLAAAQSAQCYFPKRCAFFYVALKSERQTPQFLDVAVESDFCCRVAERTPPTLSV